MKKLIMIGSALAVAGAAAAAVLPDIKRYLRMRSM
jgi:hypothetical protein